MIMQMQQHAINGDSIEFISQKEIKNGSEQCELKIYGARGGRKRKENADAESA